jgi:hypothetical protein
MTISFIRRTDVKTLSYFVMLVCLLSLQCTKNHIGDYTFYFWRTKLQFSPLEKEALHALKVRELYVRYFDVALDRAGTGAHPVGEIAPGDTAIREYAVIPVIYIVNSVFSSCDKEALDSLPHQIWNKIETMSGAIGALYNEVQFDCDWTESTKERYFSFLYKIRAVAKRGCMISATIRLHQIKYPERMGIPPVDRGMAMVYNMRNLSLDTVCSIYDHTTAVSYLPYLRRYPLHCDVACAIFSWGILARNGKIEAVQGKCSAKSIAISGAFKLVRSGVYSVTRAHFEGDTYFKEGDLVKIEAMDGGRCRDALHAAMKYLQPGRTRIAFFDLDSTHLQRIGLHELEAMCRDNR